MDLGSLKSGKSKHKSRKNALEAEKVKQKESIDAAADNSLKETSQKNALILDFELIEHDDIDSGDHDGDWEVIDKTPDEDDTNLKKDKKLKAKMKTIMSKLKKYRW